jgi:integrase/recombinase XerD
MSEICETNKNLLSAMHEKLILKAYSPSTIRTYLGEMQQFMKTLGVVGADSISPSRLKDYFLYCHRKLGLKENTLHSRINALKFFYEQVLGRERFFWDIPRPQKAFQLPNVLSENELERMFKAVSNLKHKAILFTAYSAGLRVSEVVNLQLSDLDSDRMQIMIRRSKGKKDRVVGLSVLLLDVLRAYIKQEKPRPVRYLFEGLKSGEPYSTRSAQIIFNRARKKAGITLSFKYLRTMES